MIFGKDTITTRHLAYALAEQHHIAKKQSLEMVEELIGMITKHLKKGERVKKSPGSESYRCGVVLPAWAAIRRRVKQSTSRPARRLLSAPAKT
jgi:hypothetical protein